MRYCLPLIVLLAACGPVDPIEPVPVTPEMMGRVVESLRLRDPKSADFRDVTATKQGDVFQVCGEVNAKNAFGGYVGYEPFLSTLYPTGIDQGLTGGIAMMACSDR